MAAIAAPFLEHPHRAFRNARRVVVEHRPRRLAYAGDVVPIGLVYDFRDTIVRSSETGMSGDFRVDQSRTMPPKPSGSAEIRGSKDLSTLEPFCGVSDRRNALDSTT
jgi:hypothetical protein